MALREKQNKTITFSDRSGNIISDVSDNPDDETVEVAAGVNDDDNDEGPQIPMEQDSTVEDDDADRTTRVDTDGTTEMVTTGVEQYSIARMTTLIGTLTAPSRMTTLIGSREWPPREPQECPTEKTRPREWPPKRAMPQECHKTAVPHKWSS
jgi:hypothetical protein